MDELIAILIQMRDDGLGGEIPPLNNIAVSKHTLFFMVQIRAVL